jgi:hypothetical protein
MEGMQRRPRGKAMSTTQTGVSTPTAAATASPIAAKLASVRIPFSSSQWEGEYLHLYDSIRSYGDLRSALQVEGDANALIFLMRFLVPPAAELLSHEELEELSGVLRAHLSDHRQCRIAVDETGCADEEDALTVHDAAQFALDELDRRRPVLKP